MRSRQSSKRVLRNTRTPRSFAVCLDSVGSSAPGSSRSSGMTPTATPILRPARTTRGPPRSRRPLADRRSPWLGSLATVASPTRCRCGRSARSRAHRVHAATTTPTAPGATPTDGPFGPSPTGGWASCTGAYGVASATRRSGRGQLSWKPRLDTYGPWDVYRLDEALDSGTSTIRTSYACRAPDECRTRSSGGFQSAWIGRTLYLKRAPGAGWIVQPDNSPFQVSSFLWDYVPDRIVDPRIVGAARIGAVDTTILSFYGPLNGAPYWFRLWIDHTDLVRKAKMRGYAHFMNQWYSGFDAPIMITPPRGQGG